MAKNPKIEKQRKVIDALDLKILGLLNQRADIAKKIGKLKAQSGDDVFSSGREHEILLRMVEKSAGPLPPEEVEEVFQRILIACRSIQKKLKIAFFGPEATFTHQLALKHFGRNADYTAVPSIKDVFYEVECKRADYGVVPIENSTEGIVNHTLDMFVDSDLVIIAEREEPISHFLFSGSGNMKGIKSVYSFPQALAQCRNWIDAHLPGVTIHEAASTADAAVHATLDSSSAAIASQLAGQMYHLKTAASRIEDSPDNATRFLVIGHKVQVSTGKDKTSVCFSVKDRVGALYEMLQSFKNEDLNLTKIESRPTKRKAWEYIFFVDFIGHQDDAHVKRALAELRQNCNFLKILGSYPMMN